MPGIVEAAPGVTMVTPPRDPDTAWESPNIFLAGGDRLTIVDAGYDNDDHVGMILSAAGPRTVERIVITHGHIDHAGGAWLLRERTGARVLAHPADLPSIGRRFPGRAVDGTLEDGAELDADGIRLRAMLLPGHTPGHLALSAPDTGIVFAGDLVTGTGSTLVAPPEGNMRDYMASLHKLAETDWELLLPGHGPVVEDPPGRIRELIGHRELREICVIKSLAAADVPMTLHELVAVMYLGLIHPQMVGPASWTAWAHLEKLIADGVAEKDPPDAANPYEMRFTLPPDKKSWALQSFGA